MSIYEDTPIIPEAVVNAVIEEVTVFTKICIERPAELARALVIRAERHYADDEHFRKLIRAKGNKGRDWLYAFTRHWLAAHMKKHHQVVFDKLPDSFCMGEPLNK